MKRFKTVLLAIVTILIVGCTNSTITSKAFDMEPEYSIGGAVITKNAFTFASDYPAKIIIPDIVGMHTTAFVLSFFNPAGIVAIDLNTNPLALSQTFPIVEIPESTGFVSDFYIKSLNEGFVLTSSHLIYFDPSSGVIKQTLEIAGDIDLDGEHFNSDGSIADVIMLNSPGSVTNIGNKIFVSFANYTNYFSPAACAPGIVKIYEIDENGTIVESEPKYIVATDYNPITLTKLNDEQLLISNSGVIDIVDGAGHPTTMSSVDVYDVTTSTIVNNIELGQVGLSPHPISIDEIQARGFLASSSRGEVYEINLDDLIATRDINNPIIVTGNSNGADYLPFISMSYNNQYIFVSSFDHSSVYPIEIVDGKSDILSEMSVGFPKGVTESNPTGVNTGASGSAIRPGVSGVDYTGADLFVLTGYPGSLVSIDTNTTN